MQSTTRTGNSNTERGESLADTNTDVERALSQTTNLSINDLCSILQQAADSENTGNVAGTTTTTTSPGGQQIASMLNLLSNVVPPASIMARKTPLRLVRDFVSMAPQSDNTNVDFGNVEIKIKDNRIPHDRISPAQFLEGSAKILTEMITDNCTQETILAYSRYLAKVAAFAQVFIWDKDDNFLMQSMLRQKAESNRGSIPTKKSIYA
ncbi:hypothetical protein SNE40_007860 [Patella caerulea]|uniref:Uncharacterized protein n=1 Tax=Patella caerulea TaxID=87958 RepID=A0AAN8JYS5_PATCE